MSLFKLRKKGGDEGRREKKHLQEEEDGNRKIEILKEQNTTKEKRKSHTHTQKHSKVYCKSKLRQDYKSPNSQCTFQCPIIIHGWR